MADQQASSSRSDDYAKMERLRKVISEIAQNCDAAANTWQTQIDEYTALKKRLSTLDHKLSHDIMVPFGSVAFIPGKLVKTNQVMVLLGDNWFVERSCHQAIEIIDRRIEYAKQALAEVESQKKLSLSRLGFSSQTDLPTTSHDGGETVEIMEPYDEKQEYEAKKKRVSRVLPVVAAAGEENAAKAPKGVSQREFQVLMEHLDKLEQDDDDSSEESLDSDDLPSSDDNNAADSQSNSTQKRRHSVTFMEELEVGPTPSIASIEPKTIVNEDTGFSALPKSILRNKNEKSPVDPVALQDSQQESSRPVILPMSTEVFTGVISERSSDAVGGDSWTEEKPKRLSKFKQLKTAH